MRHIFHRIVSNTAYLLEKLHFICKQAYGTGLNFAIISLCERPNIFWGLLAIFHYFDFCYFLKLEFSSLQHLSSIWKPAKFQTSTSNWLVKHLQTWMSERNPKLTYKSGLIIFSIQPVFAVFCSEVEAKMENVVLILANSLSFID